jgi:Uma2 family endonuclease
MLRVMNAAKRKARLSVEDYLAGELISPVKHEYLDGLVYAMAGARFGHNLIASNIIGALFSRLRGRPCRPLNSDSRIRIRSKNQTRFYYCDASVVCRPNEHDDTFQDEPVVIFEVLSQSARRVDEGEKKDAYLTIPSLRVYVLVEQTSVTITAFRRTDGDFIPEVWEELDSVLPLPEVGAELPLSEVYDTATFAPESDT